MSTYHGSVLVVGGGIGGVTAAVELAELGKTVYLVERTASLGGRVAGMKQYFPKLCPPTCGLEINYRRIKENPRITVLTRAEVQKIEGQAGAYTATVRVEPRYIKDDVPDPIGPYQGFEASLPDSFDYGMGKRRPAQVSHGMAFPYRPAVDLAALSDPAARAALEANAAVDFAQKPETLALKVGVIVWATGFKPYDAGKITYLKHGELADVITNVEMERLAAPNGPTQGKLVRPSDGREAKRVAFVQCAGSRDEAHLPYCSAVCCMASLKQACYVRGQFPDSEVSIFYIDIRANKYESFYKKVQADERVRFIKGKPGAVERDAASGDLIVVSEDVAKNAVVRVPVDLVVLACGMVPATATERVPAPGLDYDEYGFLLPADSQAILAVGTVKRPLDVSATVQDATAGAIRALGEGSIHG